MICARQNKTDKTGTIEEENMDDYHVKQECLAQLQLQKLKLSQTVSAPLKLGVELGGALS